LGYDKSEVNIRKIFLLILAGIIILALILYGLDTFFNFSATEEYSQMVLQPESRPLVELQQRDRQILNSYGIADSAAGTYRIPIDSAMAEILRDSKSADKK